MSGVDFILDYIWLVAVLPLAAFVIILFGKRWMGDRSAFVAIVAMSASLIIAAWTLILTILGARVEWGFPWFSAGNVSIRFGFLIDPLSATMLVVVTSVALLVQIYSLGYMHREKRLAWYYAALSLFSAAMLSLVIADNWLQLYMSWELVGLCSYLLIGFWYEKPSACRAAKKAFLVTRLGDVGFGLGIIILYWAAHTLNFHGVFKLIEEHAISPSTAALVAILMFTGAMGKSAQFPLHIWLPDAMEGPTPVSALIHAATMVAAGVYLVARSYELFLAGPVSLEVVTVIGGITAVMAALIALAMNDIKKILAYSTISQLGYMMLALGVGGLVAGIFHLVTHAFFKALLFLGSGSVIHSTGTQDIREMGGLSRKMKITTWTWLVGSLSLAGIFPLSGFWSKDEILLTALRHGHPYVLGLAIFTAGLTAFYMFRLTYIAFYGEPRGEGHAHESPLNMTAPLVVLAVPAAFAGLLGAPFLGGVFGKFIEPGEAPLAPSYLLMAGALTVAVCGILIARATYQKHHLREDWHLASPAFRGALENKFWMDEINAALLIAPTMIVASLMRAIDVYVIDGAVNAVGWIGAVISRGMHLFDLKVVDGIVNAVGAVTGGVGKRVRLVQTGNLQTYVLMFFVAVLALVWYFQR